MSCLSGLKGFGVHVGPHPLKSEVQRHLRLEGLGFRVQGSGLTLGLWET